MKASLEEAGREEEWFRGVAAEEIFLGGEEEDACLRPKFAGSLVLGRVKGFVCVCVCLRGGGRGGPRVCACVCACVCMCVVCVCVCVRT